MSKLFTKLQLTSAPKVWTDADFEELFNRPKCCDFFKELGYNKDTWIAWSSFLERTKLNYDYRKSTPCWFRWLYWKLKDRVTLNGLYLSAPVQKQVNDFLAFYEVQLAKEEKERNIRTEREREEWRQRRRKHNAETDPSRQAYKCTHHQEDYALWEAGKRDWKDVRIVWQETPFDTTRAQIELHYVWEREGTPEQKLLDILVECTNYGRTYTAEDLKAINEGKKKVEQCKPIIKEYPTPVITIDEVAKRNFIEKQNASGKRWLTADPDFYRRSDEALLKALRMQMAPTVEDARRFLRKPGEPRKIGGGAGSGPQMDLARKYLKRPESKSIKPDPPPLPDTLPSTDKK